MSDQSPPDPNASADEAAKPTRREERQAKRASRVRAPKGWGRPVANAHRARARCAAVSIYKKQPNLDEDAFQEECKVHSELVGLDPTTIIALIGLALKLYQLWKSRKASAVSVEAGLPEGELEIDFEIDEDAEAS